jgi:hypothetical protein
MRNFIYNVWMFFIPFCFWILSVTNWKPFHTSFIILLSATIFTIYDKIYSIKYNKYE